MGRNDSYGILTHKVSPVVTNCGDNSIALAEIGSYHIGMDDRERLIEAEEKAGYWQHLGNLAAERGNHELAERHYERSQKWRDTMNRLLGNGDGRTPPASSP
jgi:hypothetical protein